MQQSTLKHYYDPRENVGKFQIMPYPNKVIVRDGC